MVNTQMHIKNFIYEIITIDINIQKSYDNTIVLTDQSIFSIVKSLCLIGNIFLACFWFAIITWETSYLYRQGKEVMKMCEQSKYLDQSVGSFFLQRFWRGYLSAEVLGGGIGGPKDSSSWKICFIFISLSLNTIECTYHMVTQFQFINSNRIPLGRTYRWRDLRGFLCWCTCHWTLCPSLSR